MEKHPRYKRGRIIRY